MSSSKVSSLNLNDYLSADPTVKQKFVDDLYNSFRNTGFVVLKNHTIDPELLHKAYAIQKKFFDLPDSEKNKYINGYQRGFTPKGVEAVKGKVADIKEFYHVGREFEDDVNVEEYPRNIWVDSMPELKDTFLKIYDELEKVGDLLLHALEPKLGVKDGFFKETTRDGNSILRLLHYPPIPADADPNAERAKAHYDINTITLLVSGSSSGLQVKSKETGEWIPIEADAESITVNMGDMLSRICNDELPSTLHRVVNPDPSKNIVRYSMPFFLHFRNEVVLKCLPKFKGSGEKYPEITAGEFLNERLKEIGLKK